MDLSQTTVRQVLTRATGFLSTVASHSLQPYRGCALGNSLCGVGCYVQHNVYVTRGRPWGSFVEGRVNAADAYRAHYARERAWARRQVGLGRGRFGIFLSSSTEPFQPLERKWRLTREVLEAMVELPPDFLIVQSHSHHVADYLDLYPSLAGRCEARFHVSVESDRESLPGLPPPASSVAKRFEACAALKSAGLRTVVTVSPLLPMADPDAFFRRAAVVADAVVIDHFIGGDGSDAGGRTRRTPLPLAMEAAEPQSVSPAYRDEIVAVAEKYLPGRVGVSIDGFAGRMGSSNSGGTGAFAAGK